MKAIAFFGLFSLALVQSAQIVVFGDSWGVFGRNQFATVMGRHGLTVDNVAVGATTAQFWASLPNSLRDAVARNPDCRWVWLTIGGNDAMFKLAQGVPIPQVIEEAIRDTSTFLRPMFTQFPNVRVVQFGYDILSFSMPLCPLVADLVLPQCRLDTTCINREFSTIQFAYVDQMSRLFPAHDSVNMLGTMQAAGIPGARPGQPVLDRYTPDYMMNDCIHASATGYTALFEVLYDIYFRSQVEAMNMTNVN